MLFIRNFSLFYSKSLKVYLKCFIIKTFSLVLTMSMRTNRSYTAFFLFFFFWPGWECCFGVEIAKSPLIEEGVFCKEPCFESDPCFPGGGCLAECATAFDWEPPLWWLGVGVFSRYKLFLVWNIFKEMIFHFFTCLRWLLPSAGLLRA